MKRFRRVLRCALCFSLLLCLAAPGVAAAAPVLAAAVPAASAPAPTACAPGAAQGQADGGTLRFPKNGKLKIAVFSDVQTTQFVSGTLTECLAAILDAEQPDLVVFLGDQIEGKHPFLHLGDNEAHVKRVIDQILAPVTERGIPFAVVFGNHDAQDAGVSKEVQMAYYQSFPGCLAVDEGASLPGCGTYHLIYTSSDGTRPALNLYFVDSLEYDAKGGYGCVTKEQVAWCRTVSETLARTNGGEAVPALVFQHIIVPEIYNVFTRVRDADEPGAFAGKGAGKGGWYAAPEGLSRVEEAPRPPNYSNGQFAAWREAGDVKAAFFGHDHVNSFEARLDGVGLVACPGATLTSYNSEDARGVRIIEVDEKTIASGQYETRVLLLKDFYRPGPLAAVQRFFRMSRIWDLALLGVILGSLLVNAIFWPLFVRRRKKKRAAAKAVVMDAPGPAGDNDNAGQRPAAIEAKSTQSAGSARR